MLEQIIAWVSSIILSVSLVWKFLTKFHPKIKKTLAITEDIVKLLNILIQATEDRKVTKEEVETILSAIEELQKELKQ